MGYDRTSFTVYGSISRHNAPRDDVADALWALFKARIRELAAEEQFTELEIDIV